MNEKMHELESLLFEWENDSLSDEGVERLREMLRSDAKARDHFVQYRMINAAMQLDADAGIASSERASDVDKEPSQARSAKIHPSPFTASFWYASVLTLLVVLAGVWYAYSQLAGDAGKQPIVSNDPADRDQAEEFTSNGVAILTRLVDVEWAPDQSPQQIGDALVPGRFAIASGHAQIEFFCGATLIVEGPAELDLQTVSQARVQSGRLRAHVPPAARGFALEVDDMKVVDLGTEFGLAISPEGADVQVFDGEVELHDDSNEKRLLKKGEAVLRTAGGEYQDSRVASESFADISDLESRAKQQRSLRYENWKAWSDEVQSDSRLIAYYTFNESGDWERRLACGVQPENTELDGAIVGARQVEGRWGAKRALEFKQPADRVRVQIPGEFQEITLACWVRIDSLDRWYNSLFLTDGYDKGEPHWQILDNGQIYFSVRPVERGEQGPPDFKALSPSFWEPSMNGKWIHLAVTCDVRSRTITHYLNGKELSRHEVPKTQMPASMQVGQASIGNWALPTMPNARFAIRNLNGRMDEFAMFSAALTAEEIKDIYEHGKP